MAVMKTRCINDSCPQNKMCWRYVNNLGPSQEKAYFDYRHGRCEYFDVIPKKKEPIVSEPVKQTEQQEEQKPKKKPI